MNQENYTDLYGVQVSTWSEEWRAACEARALLKLPIDARRKEIDLRVKRRGGGSREGEDAVRAKLQDALTVEWHWQRRDVG